MSAVKTDRRRFLAGAGLALAVMAGGRVAHASTSAAGSGKLSAYIEVQPDGRIAITTPAAEMGQGIASSLPKIIAEEMDADWSQVTIRLSGADKAFANSFGRQRSANSDGVTSYFEPLRKVGATARQMLVAAAAARFGVPVEQVDVAKSVLTDRASGRTLAFADVAADAAKLPVPDEVKLKAFSDFTLLGKDTPRKDIPPKVTGEAVYGMDVVLPGMLYAAIAHVPVAGGTLKSLDADAALAKPGVRKVVALDEAVAVVADTYWQAQQAVDAVTMDFEADVRLGTEAIRDKLRKGLDGEGKILPFPTGMEGREFIMGLSDAEFEEAFANAPRTMSADYEVPYLAHATMEPICATAQVDASACTIWAPMQSADTIPPEIGELLGLAPEKVTLHRTYLGGGFGRKNERDFVREAVLIARDVPGVPVMLVWSREQDMRHDYYRPACMVRTRAALSDDGAILAMHSRIAAQPLTVPSPYRLPQFGDGSIVGGLIPQVYAMEGRRMDTAEIDLPIRAGYWRSVSMSQNGFFAESAIDDIARELGRDPLEYRIALAKDDARSVSVLKRVGEMAGWDTPLDAGRGRGVALLEGWNTRCAQVVEASVTDGFVKVERVFCAFDCGLALEPDNVKAQVEGGIIFGLSAALFGQIEFVDGVVQESSFADYPVVSMASTPEITVDLIHSDAGVGGVGEAGVPPVAPALASAIFAATGTPVRRLPIIKSGFEVAV
ncbi:xanthine dehydrogenase family protein molybdopterin-binding subunit [Croceicoccus gelatinilyticus]|uniref:xanthine dehydrogenase family protein molybdopterin-binding subunit n=1 Tax=Croceicoccus gelatinilyticus TaxID=2835536 RepID=UPI001BD14D04|nr:molybdopterin cofactor-binding domain-containing protein [Croceicoccus gelatinilyticus]